MQARTSATGSTGTHDVTYDLLGILYHALQGAETCDRYSRDAAQGGDRELADSCRQVRQENELRVDRAR